MLPHSCLLVCFFHLRTKVKVNYNLFFLFGICSQFSSYSDWFSTYCSVTMWLWMSALQKTLKWKEPFLLNANDREKKYLLLYVIFFFFLLVFVSSIFIPFLSSYSYCRHILLDYFFFLPFFLSFCLPHPMFKWCATENVYRQHKKKRKTKRNKRKK